MANDLPRGVEHIGITVPDHDAALDFLQKAFDTTILFSLVKKDQAALSADELGRKNGLSAGTRITAVSMLRFANGPNLEIFEIDRPRKQDERGISDIGISHFSVTVDDIEAATRRFQDAGGRLMEGPYDLSGQEEGEGNRGQFGLTPWGLLIEFEQFRSSIAYDDGATKTRWFPKVWSRISL